MNRRSMKEKMESKARGRKRRPSNRKNWKRVNRARRMSTQMMRTSSKEVPRKKRAMKKGRKKWERMSP